MSIAPLSPATVDMTTIISCQTSTVQDFTVQKFSNTARRRVRPSSTLGARYFMAKEEARGKPGIRGI
jgi:hypothetical protein